MNKEELLEYLESEEKKTFQGWDFSYLNNRWSDEALPWDYKQIILEYLKPTDNLLDMGTGGGEFLLTLNHPYINTTVTEGYMPNYSLCLEKLQPLGIKVYNYVGDENFLDIQDNTFDIVINRHESYNEKELFRILKPGGLFITQQVGALNNKELATFFDENHKDQFPEMTFSDSIKRLKDNKFEIIYSNEYFPTLKFYDLGAIAYFASIIKWEFINFNVKDNIDKFLILQEELNQKGYISSKEHRFVIVAVNKKI